MTARPCAELPGGNAIPITRLGRYLIERKIVSKDENVHGPIRGWMERNQRKATIARRNKSYCSSARPLSSEQKPLGARAFR